MRNDTIEILASKNKPLFNDASTAEICLYTSLRALYSSYHKGEINRDNAKSEKIKIIAKCQKLEDTYLDWCSAYKYYQDNIRKAGTLLSDIEKSNNVREIALLACKAISLMTSDTSFIKRQEKKIKEVNDDY